MAVSFSTLVYSHCFDMYAKPITVTPLASSPGAPAYAGMRAIYNSGPLTLTDEEGIVTAVIEDHETIIDIRIVEFGTGGYAVLQQGDLVHFDADTDIVGGDFKITEGPEYNSGGQATYYIQRLETAAP